MVKILICGGRDFKDLQLMENIFASIEQSYKNDDITIIVGGAKGADRMAERFARRHKFEVQKFPADWEKHGKSAGFIRNRQMLDEGKPDFVIAVPGGPGTADMCKQAKENGFTVVEIVNMPLFAVGPSTAKH